MGGDSLHSAPVPISAVLMSSSKHISSKCGEENRAFLNCKREDPNPEKCLAQGQKVTKCVVTLLRDLHETCPKAMDAFSKCMDYYGNEFELCRKEQAQFDKVILDKTRGTYTSYGASNSGGATHVDIACDAELVRLAASLTSLPICVSSVEPEAFVAAVQGGAHMVEIGILANGDELQVLVELCHEMHVHTVVIPLHSAVHVCFKFWNRRTWTIPQVKSEAKDTAFESPVIRGLRVDEA